MCIPERMIFEIIPPSPRPSPTPSSWEREKNWGQCQDAPRVNHHTEPGERFAARPARAFRAASSTASAATIPKALKEPAG